VSQSLSLLVAEKEIGDSGNKGRFATMALGGLTPEYMHVIRVILNLDSKIVQDRGIPYLQWQTDRKSHRMAPFSVTLSDP